MSTVFGHNTFGRAVASSHHQCFVLRKRFVGSFARGWGLIDMPKVTDKRVVLKPNIIYNIAGGEINTRPEVIDATIRLLVEKGAKEVIVAEGTAYQRDITDLLWQSGIMKVLQNNQSAICRFELRRFSKSSCQGWLCQPGFLLAAQNSSRGGFANFDAQAKNPPLGWGYP